MALKFEMGTVKDEEAGEYILPWKYRLDPGAAKPEVGDWVKLWVETKYEDLIVVDVRHASVLARRAF